MPVLNGVEAAQRILESQPKTQILVLTMHESESAIRKVLNVGVRGYLLKSDGGRELVAAVEALSRRIPFLTTRVVEMVLEDYLGQNGETHDRGISLECLTPREREILQSLADSRSNKDIAFQLGLSIKTAIGYRTSMMRKLGLVSMSDLVRYAFRNRIIKL